MSRGPGRGRRPGGGSLSALTKYCLPRGQRAAKDCAGKINVIETVQESLSCCVLKCHRCHRKATLVQWEQSPGAACVLARMQANKQREIYKSYVPELHKFRASKL